MDASIATLTMTAKTEAAESIIRKSGNTPRTIMRLANNELVAKVYEHLTTKWRLYGDAMSDGSVGELVLYCGDSKMLLTDLVSDYQENEENLRISVQYDIEEPLDCLTTAASTPVPQAEPEPLIHAPVSLSDKKPKVASTRTTASKRKPEQQLTEPEECKKRRKLSVVTRIGESFSEWYQAPATNSDKVECLYREMLDRERDLFRWVSSIMTTFISSGISPPKNPF